MKIKCSDIIADPSDNTSRDEVNRMNPQDCMGLAQTIQRVGQLHPVTVKQEGDKYRLCAGFRRYTAIAIVLGWEEIEATIAPDNASQKELNAIENLHQRGRTFWEECCMLREMYPDGVEMTQIQHDLGMSKSWVNIRWKAWYLPDEVKRQIEAGLLGFSHVALLVQKKVDAERTAAKLIAGHAAGKTIKGMRKGITGSSQVRAKKQIMKVMTRLLKRENMPMVQALRYAIGEIEEVTLFNWLDEPRNKAIVKVDDPPTDQPN